MVWLFLLIGLFVVIGIRATREHGLLPHLMVVCGAAAILIFWMTQLSTGT